MEVKGIGKRLRAYRKLKNLTQEEFADLLGVSVAIVGGIERETRTPSKAVLHAILQNLDISEAELQGTGR